MNQKELKEKLRILSLLTTQAIAIAKSNEASLLELKNEVATIKETQPYLIKRIGELTKRCKQQ